MAKQGVKDIRVDFVEAIGKTENLKTIRSICYDLEKRPMRSRLTQQSINSMLENGYNKIVSLLGEDAYEYFLPTMLMREVGVSKYFEMLKRGLKNLEVVKTAIEHFERQKSILPNKISKAEKEGDIVEVYRCKQLLMAYTNPSYFWKLYGKEYDMIDGKIPRNPNEEQKHLFLSRFEAENATCLYAVVYNVDFEGLMIYDDDKKDKYEAEQLLKEKLEESMPLKNRISKYLPLLRYIDDKYAREYYEKHLEDYKWFYGSVDEALCEKFEANEQNKDQENNKLKYSQINQTWVMKKKGKNFGIFEDPQKLKVKVKKNEIVINCELASYILEWYNFMKFIDEELIYYFGYNMFDGEGHVSESPNRFLFNYLGKIKLDYEHLLLLYKYLKSEKSKNIHETEALLCYSMMIILGTELSVHTGSQYTLTINPTPTDFGVGKPYRYDCKYTASYLLPMGYRGYMFEPKNLNQQSLVSALDLDNLSVESMVGKFKEAQTYMKKRKNGVLFSFLSKDMENRLIPYIITSDFAINWMDGDYSKVLQDEYLDRRKKFGGSNSFEIMTNMYKRVVKPYNLEILGSYLRTFCSNLQNLEDKDSIYIYYLTPQRVGFAVREDITKEMLEEVFDEKFLSNLEEIKMPTLDDLLSGEYI